MKKRLRLHSYAAVSVLVVMIPLFFAVAAPQKIRIMPLGDSRTAGPDSRNCYRLYLDRMMTDSSYSYDFVGSLKGVSGGSKADSLFDDDHEGHWGWTTDNLLPHLGGYARTYRPDIVLAMLGTTDILQENNAGEALNDKLSRTVKEIGAAIDTLRSVNDSVVILLALLYAVVSLDHTAQIESLNVRLPVLALHKSTQKSPVIIVDMWSVVNRLGDLWDAYHANKYGCIKIAGQWLKTLKQFLAPGPSALAMPIEQRLWYVLPNGSYESIETGKGLIKEVHLFTWSGRRYHFKEGGRRRFFFVF